MKKTRTIIFILILASIIGCAHAPEKELSAQDLFDKATLLASKGKVEEATEAFMKVRTYYPGHELARKALLATADLNYDKELYDKALENYKEYRLLYPTDTDAYYSLYKIGMCYFKQMNSFDRDQSQSLKAARALQDFIDSSPDSPYVSNARDNLAQAKLNIARHDIYVGKFYLKKHKNEAACKRFRYVKLQYPGLGLDEELDKLIAKACGKDQKAGSITKDPQQQGR